MGGAVYLLAAAFLVPWWNGLVDDPRATVRRATRAVEGDSVGPVQAQWEAQLGRASSAGRARLGLATLARLTYRYDVAEHHYGALIGDGATAPGVKTYARIGQAQILETHRQLAAADSLYERAAADARAAGDSAAEASVLLNLFAIRTSTVGRAQAEPLLRRAERLIPHAALDLRAQHYCLRANALFLAGRLDEVAAAVAGGIAAARRAGEPTIEARCLNGVARVARARGQLDSAQAVLGTAAALQHRVHDLPGLARTLLYAGQVSMLQGRYGEAKVELARALQTAETSGDSAGIGSANLGLADVALSVRDHQSAAMHLARATAMFEAQGDRDRATVARVWAAQLAASLGRFAEARTQTREVLRWYEESGNVEGQGVQYRALANWATRERDWGAAVEALRVAGDLARRHSLRLLAEKLVYDEAQLARARGDLAAARRLYERYLRSLAAGASVQRAETQARLAEVDARRGDLASAERELRSASEALDRWRATLGDAELRVLAFQATSSEASDVGRSVATALAQLAIGGRAAAAFELAEGRRARELADRLARAEALRAAGSTGAGSSEPAPRGDHWTPGVSAADIAAALPDSSTAVVEYVTGPGDAPTTAFVLTRAGLRAYAAPPVDSLAPLIARFTALVEAGSDARALGGTLGAVVLDPVIAALGPGVTRLVVVPDGALHRLPFDALRLPDGRYAVERFAVSVVPSASVLRDLWQRGRARQARRGPMRLLAFGDPTFAAGRGGSELAADDGARDTFRSAATVAGGLSRLVESGREARLVARYAAGAVVRLRGDASEAYLKQAPLADFRVIHFATHALVSDDDAARTLLALAPGGGETGFVAPGDLAALRLDADLVVLSACRSAGGVLVTGEGMQGLTSPLLQAGARSVVATGWRIGDRGTVSFVRDFYAALARGHPVGDALRAAKLAAIERGAPPGEWAAFGVVGDPLVTVPLRAPSLFARWWLALPVLAGLAVPAYCRQRRRSATTPATHRSPASSRTSPSR